MGRRGEGKSSRGCGFGFVEILTNFSLRFSRENNGETGKQGNRETGKQGNGEKGKQGNRETGKQGSRETGKPEKVKTASLFE
jgi:hypothetical protein